VPPKKCLDEFDGVIHREAPFRRVHRKAVRRTCANQEG
jgi:hypothetical protein